MSKKKNREGKNMWPITEAIIVILITAIIAIALIIYAANNNSFMAFVSGIVVIMTGFIIFNDISLPIKNAYPVSYTAEIAKEKTNYGIESYNSNATRKNTICFYAVYEDGDTFIPYGEIRTISYSKFDIKDISNKNDFAYIKKDEPFMYNGYNTNPPCLVIPDTEYESALQNASDGDIVSGGSLNQ